MFEAQTRPTPPDPLLRNAVDSLREAVRLRQVVPIVGPETLTVSVPGGQDGRRVAPFYRLVAERLLGKFNLEHALLNGPGPAWDLHRATRAVMAATGQSAARLRRSVATSIREVSEQAEPEGALKALAGLRCFSLMISLTPDESLFRALARASSPMSVEVRSYTPRSDTGQASQDVPPPAPGQVQLFHLLGRCESDTEFAIHEEDTLEYLYRFREDGERRFKTLLTALRGSDLLFLGCSLPDWMGRGLVRLANTERLAATERTMEFFCASARDARLSQFLDGFSSQSTVFPWTSQELIEEIAAWDVGHGTARQRAASPPGRPRPHSAPSAVISYASEDTDAARCIAASLQSVGFGEIWLDKHRLIAGDDWSSRIDEAIAQCDFFVPLLSRQADARREGVYWEEWRKALTRAMRVADAFLLPIGIDDLPPRKAGYGRIFSGVTKPFGDVHLAHGPQGLLTDDSRAQLSQRVQSYIDGSGRG